jgi:superfamily I DNA/RNA helicase
MAHDNGSLAGVVHVDGVPLTDSASAWRQGRTILVTTARSFKGLEADAVIVYDVGVLGDRFSLTDLYVACTRARTVLQLIIHDARTARQIQDAIDRASSEGGAARGTPWI